MPQPGEIWLAEIPYTNGVASKLRPVLVLWVGVADVVSVAVTSIAPRAPTDVPLRDWATEGLRVPSCVRLLRLDSLEQSLFSRKLGVISPADAIRLRQVWADRIQLRF